MIKLTIWNNVSACIKQLRKRRCNSAPTAPVCSKSYHRPTGMYSVVFAMISLLYIANLYAAGTPGSFYCYAWNANRERVNPEPLLLSNVYHACWGGPSPVMTDEEILAEAVRTKEWLDKLPVGRRAIFTSAPINNGSQNYLWWDTGVTAVRNVMRKYFKDLHDLGATVDQVFTDFEGGMTNWNIDGGSGVIDRWQAIVDDPRYATDIRPRLLAKGFTFTGEGNELHRVCYYWGFDLQYVMIWNDLAMIRLAEYLNQAVFNPAKEYYPNVTGSNYEVKKVGGAYPCPDLSGFPIYGYGNTGAVAGTHSSTVNYGWLWSITVRIPPGTASYPSAPFNGFKFAVNTMLGSCLVDPKNQPWIANKSFTGDGCVIGNTDYYEESILHVALCNPDPFLGWFCYTFPGDGEPGIRALDNQVTLVNNLLKEMDEIAGYTGKDLIKPGAWDWSKPYVLTGMKTGGRNVWRITPDLNVVSKANFKTGDSPLTFRAGIFNIRFPLGSQIYTPPNEYGLVGYWVTSPLGSAAPQETCDFAPLLWLSADTGVTADAQSNVSAWVSHGSQPLTVRQTVSAHQPALIAAAVGGKPGVRFGQSQRWLEISDLGSVGDSFIGSLTTYAVFTGATINGDNRIVSAVANGNDYMNGQGFKITDGITSTTELKNGIELKIGGGQIDSRLNVINIGVMGPGYGGFTGDLAEVLIFKGFVSPTLSSAILSYLKDKYGLSTEPTTASGRWINKTGGSSAPWCVVRSQTGFVTVRVMGPTPVRSIKLIDATGKIIAKNSGSSAIRVPQSRFGSRVFFVVTEGIGGVTTFSYASASNTSFRSKR